MSFNEGDYYEVMNLALGRASRQVFMDLRRVTGLVSRTLYSTLEYEGPIVKGRTATVRMYSPYFWSRILDQGRKAQFEPKRAKMFAWFRDPLGKDPRLSGEWFRTSGAANAAKLDLDRETFRNLVESGELVISRYLPPIVPYNFVETGTMFTDVYMTRELRKAQLAFIRSITRGKRIYRGKTRF